MAGGALRWAVSAPVWGEVTKASEGQRSLERGEVWASRGVGVTLRHILVDGAFSVLMRTRRESVLWEGRAPPLPGGLG